MDFNPNLPTAWEQQADDNRGRVYCTKQLSNGTVEAYSRSYTFLGVLTTEGLDHLYETSRVQERWQGWTGGKEETPGDALWWELK